VERPSDRIIHIRLILGETIVSFVSIYAPQTGLLETDKDKFYDELLTYVAGISASEITFVCGDFNGHIGNSTDGYDGIHGGNGFGKRNSEGERILDFAMAADLVVSNSFFKKRLSHLVTYQSGSAKSQIDYILTRKKDRNLVSNTKCIAGEECASQHKLLIADLKIKVPLPKKRKFLPKCQLWKLRKPEVQERYREKVASKLEELPLTGDNNPESLWLYFKTSLKDAAFETYGMSKKPQEEK